MGFIDLLQLVRQTAVDQTIRKTATSSRSNGNDSSSFANLIHVLSTTEITPDDENLGETMTLGLENDLSLEEDHQVYSQSLHDLIENLEYILKQLNQTMDNKTVPSSDDLDTLYGANALQTTGIEEKIPSQLVHPLISFGGKHPFMSEEGGSFQSNLPEKKLAGVITELLQQLRLRQSEVAQEQGQDAQQRNHVLPLEGLMDTIHTLSKEIPVDQQGKEMVLNKLGDLSRLTIVTEEEAKLQQLLLMQKKQLTVEEPINFENQYSFNNILLKTEGNRLADGSNLFINSLPVLLSDGLKEAAPVAAIDQGLQLKEVPVRSTIEETIQPRIVRMSHIIEDLSNIFRGTLRINASMEGTQLRLNIFPEHLGHLDIRIMESNGKIAAQIIASSLMAKDALELQLNQLRTALQQQGLLIDKLEITHEGLQQTFEQHGEKAFSQQQQKGQSDPKKNGYSFPEEEKIQPRMKDNLVARVDYTI